MSWVRTGRTGRAVRRGRAAAAVATAALALSAVLAGGQAGAATRADGPAQPARAGQRQAGGGSGAAAPGIVSTVAGGVGGPAPATQVGLGADGIGPAELAYASGGLYVADYGSVRRVSAHTGGLTTPAGVGLTSAEEDITPRPGPIGDGGPATRAIMQASGVAIDHAGNLVIADTGYNRIQVVARATGRFYGRAMTAGDIYSVAGDGATGFSGDGGPASKATFYYPRAVAVDPAGNLLITDTFNGRIRVVAERTGTFYGIAMTAGDIYTVAGGGSSGLGDGGPATHAELTFPRAVTSDHAGNLVIADSRDNRIRVVAATTGTFYGRQMTAGHIYTVAGDGHRGFSGDGGPATAAEMRYPQGVAVDGAGNLAIADTGNNRVRVVAARTGTYYGIAMTAGDIYTVAGDGGHGFSGDGGPATAAQVHSPTNVVTDAAGNLAISIGRRVQLVAARTGEFYGQAMTGGDIYTVAGFGSWLVSGNGRLATTAQIEFPDAVASDGAGDLAITEYPSMIQVVPARTGTMYGRAMTAHHIYSVPGPGYDGVALDGARNLVIADTGHNEIRVLANRSGTFYGIPMTAGHLYTVAGDGKKGYSGDQGPATKAELNQPQYVAVDGAGNLVIADTGNNLVRVVAEHTGTFYGQQMTAGDIYTVAGDGTAGCAGDGGGAIFAQVKPGDVAVTSAGIFTPCLTRIRMVALRTGEFYRIAMTAGRIYTVAGDGAEGYSGDGGPATDAALFPGGVTTDHDGNLVIADDGNNRIRVVALRTGTFYGIAMKAGYIYTVAGNGTEGFAGDGGPAARAEFDGPGDVAVNGAGDLLIADTGNYRVREVTR